MVYVPSSSVCPPGCASSSVWGVTVTPSELSRTWWTLGNIPPPSLSSPLLHSTLRTRVRRCVHLPLRWRFESEWIQRRLKSKRQCVIYRCMSTTQAFEVFVSSLSCSDNLDLSLPKPWAFHWNTGTDKQGAALTIRHLVRRQEET